MNITSSLYTLQLEICGVSQWPRRRAAEATDVERSERAQRGPVAHELGDDDTDHGAKLKAVSRETERVDHVRCRAAEADNRQMIRHLAFDAGPTSDHEGRFQCRNHFERLVDRARRNVGQGSRALEP